MCQVGQASALAHLLIVVFCRERERVVDAVGIAGNRHLPSSAYNPRQIASTATFAGEPADDALQSFGVELIECRPLL